MTNNKLSLRNIWIIEQMGKGGGGALGCTPINCGYICAVSTLLNSCPILNKRMRQIKLLCPVEGPNPKNDILHVFKGKTKN